MAGRTPDHRERACSARATAPIHWGQEMFDQAGMLREFVKWDYELRLPMQADERRAARARSDDDARRAARPI